MELRKIKDLIRTVDSSNIVELEIEDNGFRMRLRKQEQVVTNVITPESTPVVQAEPVVQSDAKQEEELSTNIAEIVAPMVGTFYRAPAPDAEPYVSVGDVVEEGQTMFIIEAMKMMNEIESEYRGKVVQFLVENGEPIEYGQPLIRIELSK